MGLAIDLRVNGETVGWAWAQNVGGTPAVADYVVDYWSRVPLLGTPPEKSARVSGFERSRGALALAREALAALEEGGPFLSVTLP